MSKSTFTRKARKRGQFLPFFLLEKGKFLAENKLERNDMREGEGITMATKTFGI